MSIDVSPKQITRAERSIYIITAIVTSITSFFAALNGISEEFKNTVTVFSNIPKLPSLAIATLLLVLCIWSFKKSRKTSRLLRPESLRLERDQPEHLIGRNEDVAVLLELCRQHPLVFVEGESGSGKSALLQSGLVPKLNDDANLHPVYVPSLVGPDWERDPQRFLQSELLASLNQTDKEKFPKTTDWADFGPNGGLASFQALLGRRPLIVLDQFDDYQIRHREKFLDHKTWLKPDQLCGNNEFWRSLRSLIQNHAIHLLIVTRTDTAGGLSSVHFSEPEMFRLDRLGKQFIVPILTCLEKPNDGGDVIADPNFGWSKLRLRLEDDLETEGTILPQQLKMVLSGLSCLPRGELTIGAYQKIGGITGVEANYIETCIAKTARLCSLEKAQVRGLLLLMIDSKTKDKTIEVSENKLVAAICKSADLTIKALEEMERAELVRRHQDVVSGDTTWALDHDYLAHGVIETNRIANRWSHELADGSKALTRAASIIERWHALLPAGTQISLWRDRLLGRFRYANYKFYAIVCTLRFVPMLSAIMLLGGLAAYELERRSLSEVRNSAENILKKFDDRVGINQTEAATLLELRSSDPEIQKYLTEEFLTDPHRANIFVAQPRQLARALSELSPSYQYWFNNLLKDLNPIEKSTKSIIIKSRLLFGVNIGLREELLYQDWLHGINIIDFDTFNLTFVRRELESSLADLDHEQAQIAFEAFLDAFESAANEEAFDALETGLEAVANKLTSSQAPIILHKLIRTIETQNNYPAQSALGTGLKAVVNKLSSDQLPDAFKTLLQKAEIPLPSSARWALNDGLTQVVTNLTSEQAPNAFNTLLESIKNTVDPDDRYYQLGIVAKKLDVRHAKLAFIPLIKVIEGTKGKLDRLEDSTLESLEIGLQSVAYKLTGEHAQKGFTTLLQATEHMTDRDQQYVLKKGLETVANRISRQQARDSIALIIQAIENSQSPGTLAALDSALVHTAHKLSSAQVERILETLNEKPEASPLYLTLDNGLAALLNEATYDTVQFYLEVFLANIGTFTESNWSRYYWQRLESLINKLDADRAQSAIDLWLKNITTQDYRIDTINLIFSLPSITKQLTAEQTQLAFEVLFRAIETETNIDTLNSLTSSLESAAATLDEKQGKIALTVLLNGFDKTLNVDALPAIGNGLVILANKLDNEQAEAAIEVWFEIIESYSTDETPFSFARELPGLASKLSVEQVQKTLDLLVLAIERIDETVHPALKNGLPAIATRLSNEQAYNTLIALTEAIEGLRDPELLLPGLSAVALRLASTQPQKALDTLILAIENTTDPDAKDVLVSGLASITTALTEEQAQKALITMLKVIESTSNWYIQKSLGSQLAIFANKMTIDQSQMYFYTLLRFIETSTNPDTLNTLAAGLDAVSRKLHRDPDLIKNSDQIVPILIDSVSIPLVSEQFEQAIVNLLEKISGSDFHDDIWEAVKWISPEQSEKRLRETTH